MTSKIILSIAAVVLLVIGEIVTIYCELLAAKSIIPSPSAAASVLMKPAVLISVAGICLILAYWLGYQVVGNIWVVTVASVTSILILEPIVIWFMFREAPSTGAAIGFALGSLGFIASVTL